MLFLEEGKPVSGNISAQKRIYSARSVYCFKIGFLKQKYFSKEHDGYFMKYKKDLLP